MMKNWKSILFAVLIFTSLSAYEAQAQGVALDSAQVRLILRDSENAHAVATAALGAVGCILASLSGTAEWSPQECAERLEAVIDKYAQEHLVLHPMVVHMLKGKMAQKAS